MVQGCYVCVEVTGGFAYYMGRFKVGLVGLYIRVFGGLYNARGYVIAVLREDYTNVIDLSMGLSAMICRARCTNCGASVVTYHLGS